MQEKGGEALKEIFFAALATPVLVALCCLQFRLLRKGNPKTDLLISLWKQLGEGKREEPSGPDAPVAPSC